MLSKRWMVLLTFVTSSCTGYDIPILPGSINGGDASVDQLAPPSGCDITVEPKDSPECVVDSYAIFVSTEGGNTSNLGTRNSPVASINQAVKLAAQQGKPRVYVCGTGKIDEQVKLTNAAVSLYGGFSCSDWGYNDGADNKAHVAPSVRGAALTLTTLSETITIADLLFEAQPAVDPGESSVAVIANQSIVTFTRCDLTAGDGRNGQDGASGDAASNYDTSLSASSLQMVGYSATNGLGAPAQPCTPCVNGSISTGGRGGNGSYADNVTHLPTDGAIGTPNNGGGMGGLASTASTGCSTGGNGAPGTIGASGVTPTPGAAGTVTTGSGLFQPDGTWLPAWSQGGTGGGIGQGGGGGGGGTSGGSNIGGGGGGGCGGCGGSPGTKAQAGGASIALISFKSQVSLKSCTLTTGQAGTGGNGAAGQPGQAGGNGGTQTSGGCQGGAGGKGGNGGASAGGAGGIAAGILFSGQTPLPDASTVFTLGNKGSAGAGGAASNAGLDGKAATILQLVP